MCDHVKFGVGDYASKAFFLKALEPLGVAVVSDGTPSYGPSERWPQGTRPRILHALWICAHSSALELRHPTLGAET